MEMDNGKAVSQTNPVPTMNVYSGGTVVVPSDTVDLATPANGLYVGGAGNVKVTLSNGSTVTLSNVTAGSVLPINVTRVFATGTTATLMVALG